MTGIPMWFNDATVSEKYASVTGFHYCWVEYLGIRFRVSGDKMKFNAEDVIKAFSSSIDPKTGKMKYGKKWDDFIKCQDGKYVMSQYGDEIVTVKNSKTANGHYIPWAVFDGLLYRVGGIGNAVRFLKGEELDLSTPGYLYLVQPEAAPHKSGIETCLGTDIFKFGRTWNMNQRMNMYGEGTEIYCKVHVSDMKVGEAILIEKAKLKAVNQEAAYNNEYFEYEDGFDALEAFDAAIEEMRSKGLEVRNEM